jgi:hypothetical protein
MPTPLEYADYVAQLRVGWPKLADAFSGRDSIEHVLDWMDRRGFPPGSVDIVAQDEFSYDFLIRLEPEDRWLAFGVN